MKRTSLPALAFVICLAGASWTLADGGHTALHWGYEGATGPAHWGDLSHDYAACSVGARQSPVDIEEATLAGLPAIDIEWGAGETRMVNNGHTIQVDVPAGSFLRRGGETYELLQFHFHAPSEHEVQGRRFPMEAHFVHRRVGSDDLGVLAVFLDSGGENESFARLASHFPAKEGVSVEVDDVDITGLFPDEREYWFYDGSLTTPPCSEKVSWMVLQHPVKVSGDDITRFRALYPMNARPVAPANGRPILSSSASPVAAHD